jgi:DNA-binding response OmpR family regulator
VEKSFEILLAEDEEHIAKLVAFKLNRDGFQLTIAKNGQEAMDHLDSKKWSLIILDVMMPIYDGWQVLKTARSTLGDEIPVLMLTAKSHQKDVANAAELGATQFMKKPFDPAELSTLVKKMVCHD